MNRIRRRRDERGAVIVMATVGIVVAVIAAALSVDIGRIAEERRRNQKVADLAALDASRDLTSVQSLAEASATRNRFPIGNGNTIVAVEGNKVNGQCVAQAGTGKACVTVTSHPNNMFRPGGATVVTRALAGRTAVAGFTEGSSLASASLDNELPVLNGVFKTLLGSSGNINLVSYQGLANANVKVRDLQAALGFGTLNELLTTQITVAQLLNATATVLNNQGTVDSYDVATKLVTLRDSTTNSRTFSVGDFLVVGQGADNKVANASLNVLQLITAGAELANKNNFLDAGSIITLPVPGVGNVNTKLGLKVIDGPKHYIGPAGGPTPALHTGQVQLTLTPQLDVNFTAGLLNSPLHIVGDLPVTFEAAGADGTLTDVRCNTPQGISVKIVSQPIQETSSATLNVFDQGILSLLQVRATVAVNPSPVTTAAQTTNLDFAYSSEFTPTFAGKSTTSAVPALTLSSSNVTVTATALGLPVGVTTTQVLNSTLNPILQPTLNSVVSKIATPAMKALGLGIGVVDVTAPLDDYSATGCGQPTLLG